MLPCLHAVRTVVIVRKDGEELRVPPCPNVVALVAACFAEGLENAMVGRQALKVVPIEYENQEVACGDDARVARRKRYHQQHGHGEVYPSLRRM